MRPPEGLRGRGPPSAEARAAGAAPSQGRGIVAPRDAIGGAGARRVQHLGSKAGDAGCLQALEAGVHARPVSVGAAELGAEQPFRLGPRLRGAAANGLQNLRWKVASVGRRSGSAWRQGRTRASRSGSGSAFGSKRPERFFQSRRETEMLPLAARDVDENAGAFAEAPARRNGEARLAGDGVSRAVRQGEVPNASGLQEVCF
ncbi:hypothetical protein ACFODL_06755 [Phenylobacterium terrae]|uniref:Uncharacterized protein n=1 Tax=Phenylobacterium terrae TaxID=2665495 RepID=A0ABW4N671_9CAUL